MYFVVNKISLFFFFFLFFVFFLVSGAGPLLSFACTHFYYTYKMTKCIQHVLEVLNIQ